MFKSDNVVGFLMRLMVFLLIFSSYPLLHHFARRLVIILLGKDEDNISLSLLITINLGLGLPPIILALTYPNVGDILGYLGSMAGFFALYFIPCMVHLKR
jgi:hypothetical protein